MQLPNGDTDDHHWDTMAAEFNDTRATLQRVSDAKFHYGWVENVDKTTCSVRLREPISAQIGESFHLEAHGAQRIASFQGILKKMDDRVLTFAMDRIVYQPPRENFRLALKDVSGDLTYGSLTSSVRVIDVSLLGAGIRSFTPIERGSVVSVRMEMPAGDVTFRAEVRYCRPDQEAPGTFRVGLQISEMGRIEKARWTRSFDHLAPTG